MLYLIGLGLNKEGFSYEAANAIKNCRKVYLESYTVELPYGADEIAELVGKKVVALERDEVEDDVIVKEAKTQNVALLVYGNPLMATTHVSLMQEARKLKVPVRVIHAASVLDAVGETGLQIYKFGKIISLPEWTDSYKPTSFVETVKENEKINAHSLILVDIGLSFKDAVKQLEEAGLKLGKVVVCSRLGMKDSKIFYGDAKRAKDVKAPFCFIIPSELHFLEKEVLESFK